MLESTVGDCAKKFGLQQEVAETSRVNTDVTALGAGCTTADSQVSLLFLSVGDGAISSSCRGFGGLKLLVGVVDEILFGRHFDGLGGLKRLVGLMIESSATS